MNVQFWGLVIIIFYFMKFKFVGVFKKQNSMFNIKIQRYKNMLIILLEKDKMMRRSLAGQKIYNYTFI